MKNYFLAILLSVTAISLSAQTNPVDSLKRATEMPGDDTTRYSQYDILSAAYSETKADSSLSYAQKALEIARKLKCKLNEAMALSLMGYAQQNMGNYPRALQAYLTAITIAEDPENEKNILPGDYLKYFQLPPNTTGLLFRLNILGSLHEFTGILYENANLYQRELYHLSQARQYAEQIGDSLHLGEVYYILGRAHLYMKNLDSAFIYEHKAIEIAIRLQIPFRSGPLLTLGKYYVEIGRNEEATEYLRQALSLSKHERYVRGEIASSLLLSNIARQQHNLDSSLYFANSALALAQQLNSPDLLLRTYTELVEFYSSSNRSDSTAKYQALIIKLKDTLFNSKQAQEFQNVDFDEQQRQQEIESVKKTYRDRFQKYGLLAGLMAVLFIAIVLWRNNRNRKKAYALLKMQKQETDFQKSKVEETLEELKSTQAQLIQSEKMASLGELTAGIAHEIQNPLNFVNNFSEVNNELIEELKSKKAKLKSQNEGTQEEDELLDDIAKNLEKINFHGKRADAIVKGMLQHSRTSSGQKELTDINALCDEYVRLAYHGLRAKDKSFNAQFETDFDSNLPKINIVPQDIGRVILNLINNAFYAVTEKKKSQAEDYRPLVTITTKAVKTPTGGTGALIKVKDNGNGIPGNIVDKIFQPFFTTKPTGQGTGLGLSLSYDIIKAHGGEIKVETKDGEGTTFLITLQTDKVQHS